MPNNLSVLLVEDVPDNANLAELIFIRAGFAVTTVARGADALTALDRGTYDVVALDIRLPDMDGLVLARALRADARLEQAPIVAITAHAMKGDRERALEAGCDAYVTKPVDTRSLAQDLVLIVDEFRAHRGSPAPP